jgi:hypothetical protein
MYSRLLQNSENIPVDVDIRAKTFSKKITIRIRIFFILAFR